MEGKDGSSAHQFTGGEPKPHNWLASVTRGREGDIDQRQSMQTCWERHDTDASRDIEQ